jgi:uncharacterized protein
MLDPVLIEAACDGNTPFILQYIKGNADSDDGYIALSNAASCGRMETVRALLEAGACVNGGANGRGHTPLMSAAQSGQEAMVTFLLERNADVNAQTERVGETALMFAATHWKKEGVVNLLLAHGGDVKAANRHSQTPLMYAMQSNSTSIVRALVKKGADVAAVDKNGCSALHFATDPDVIRCLVACGAPVDLRDIRGDTPLMWRARAGKDGAVEALLDCGTDIHFMNQRTRRSALRNALYGRNRETACLLIERGADLQERDNKGTTSREWAVENGWMFILNEIDAVTEQMIGQSSTQKSV